MRRQIQKTGNGDSPENQVFRSKLRESAYTPPVAADLKAKIYDLVPVEDAGVDRFSFEYIRSFYREQCEAELAKINQNASFQTESKRFVFPRRRSLRISPNSVSALGGDLARDLAISASLPALEEVEEVEEVEEDDSASEEGEVVVIVTYSRSPEEDFQRSMLEVVAARVESGEEVDRQFMEELLIHYLEINNEKFYRSILHAFLELIGVGGGFERTPPRRRRWSGGFSRRKLKLEIKNMQKFCRKYRCTFSSHNN